MYYEDHSRKINFISGLFLGMVLGSGLTMIVVDQGPKLQRGSSAGPLAQLKAETLQRFGTKKRRGKSRAREIEQQIRGAVKRKVRS